MDTIKIWLGVPGAEERAKAKKYGKLADKLEEKKSEIKEYYDDASNNLEACNSALICNPDSAQGLILTTFDTHQERWKEKYDRILNNVEMGITGLESCIKMARQMEETWNQIADSKEAQARGGF